MTTDAKGPDRPPVALTWEGGGVVTTCKRCGRVQFHRSKPSAEAEARTHQCKGKKRR